MIKSFRSINISLFLAVALCILLETQIAKLFGLRLELLLYVVVIVTVIFFRLGGKRRITVSISPLLLMALYSFYLALSAIWSVSGFDSFLYSMILIISILYVGGVKQSDNDLIYVVYLLFVLAMACWMYYFIAGDSALSPKDVAWRLKGILFHEQRLALFMGIALILVSYLYVYKRIRFNFYIYTIFFVTLLATQARAFVAFSILTCLLLFAHQLSLKKKLCFFGGCVLLFLVILAGWDSISPLLFRGDADLSLTGRIPIWQHTLERYTENPALGFGFLSFSTEGVAQEIFKNYVPAHAHNMYINTLFEVGFVGLFLLALGMAGMVYCTSSSLVGYMVLFALLCGGMGVVFGSSLNGISLLILLLASIEGRLRIIKI